MKWRRVHPFKVSPAEARQIQGELREKIFLESPKHLAKPIKLVAGADCSYARNEATMWAAIVVLGLPGFEVREVSQVKEAAVFPYIPGLLTFREAPALLSAFEKLSLEPDVIMIDGQGIAHPQGLGLAAHLGFLLDRPTMGCAKSRLVGEYDEPGEEVGDYSPLIYQEKIVGAVLRTRKKTKPVFISPGFKISLETALKVATVCLAGYRIPEPVRRAHILSNRYRAGN
ncbi:MAG: deoxyribonuclease V [bacterium]